MAEADPQEQQTPPADLTTEELQQLQENPDLLIDNPELEARLDAALQRGQTAPPAPTETPAAETPVETPPAETPAPVAETPAVQDVPALLQDIPADQRRTVLEAWMADLSPEERRQLKPVNELLAEAERSAEQRGEFRGAEQRAERNYEAEIATARDRIGISDDDANALLQPERERLTNNLSTRLNGFLKNYNLSASHMPAELRQELSRLPASEAVFRASAWVVDTAYQSGITQGESRGKEQAATMSEADKIVTRAALKHEALADLAKGGRIRIAKDSEGLFAEYVKDDVPPVISGHGVAAGGSELTQEEFQQYQRLVVENPDAITPELQEKVDRAFAASMKSGRA